MRLVFAGTPQVAADTLTHLLDHGGHEVVAVLTRPDAPQGRSKRPVPSPVAALAQERGIEVLRPARAADPGLAARLAELAPQCCPVVAYGGLIPQTLLEPPEHGWVNVHFSLLPRWRGAAPVQHAILAGDEVTGVTVFELVAALDAGPVLGTREYRFGAADTAGGRTRSTATTRGAPARRDTRPARRRDRHRTRPASGGRDPRSEAERGCRTHRLDAGRRRALPPGPSEQPIAGVLDRAGS